MTYAEQVAEQVELLRAIATGADERVAQLTGSLAQQTAATADAQSALADAGRGLEALRSDLAACQGARLTLEQRIRELEAKLDDGVLPYWGAPAWRDEFDGTALDPAKWNVRDRAGADGMGLLNDASVIDKTLPSVSGGAAHLRAEWLASPVVTTTGPSGNPTNRWHRTSYVDHKATSVRPAVYAQQYGRWEIRAKVDTGPNSLGSLCAFWLRNANSGEIDIMEAWGFGAAPMVNSRGEKQRGGTSTLTTHTQTSGTGNVKKAVTIEQALGITAPAYDDFHTWALEFTPTYFRGYRDGLKFCDWTPADTPQLWNPAYFGSPLHVRMNLHVGPSVDYWGLPNPANKTLTKPLDFQVSHVRIWKMP